jgi:hypothetical protein
MPFPARTRDELFTKIERGKYHFDHKEFKVVSVEAIDLIKQMLTHNPKRRI